MGTVSIMFVWDEDLKVYTAYVTDVPVCGEGPTKEAALSHLKEGLAWYIQDVGREEFLSRIVGPIEHEEVALEQLV